MVMYSFLSHIQSGALFDAWKGVGYDQVERLDARLREVERFLRVQCCTTKASRAFVITCRLCGHQGAGAYGINMPRFQKVAAMEVLTTMWLGEALSEELSGHV